MGDFRKNFGRVKKFLDIPNLIEIQTRSYEKFLQQDWRWQREVASGSKALLRVCFLFRISAGSVLWSLSATKLAMSVIMRRSVSKRE